MFIQKKRGMFGGVAMPGQSIVAGDQPPQELPPQQEAPDPAPGLGMRGAPVPAKHKFGWLDALGSAGDALAAYGGLEGGYGKAMQARRQAAAELAAEQRKRSLGLEDYVAKKKIDQQYQPPAAPDAFERALIGAGIDPTSERGKTLYQSRAESMARDPNDEFVVVPIPGVGTYAGMRSGLAEAMGGAPQRKLGPIVDSIPGGPTPPASGNFPR